MKKMLDCILKLILSLFLVGSLTGCTSIQESTPKDIIYDRPAGIVEIDYESLKEKINSNTDFILYIGRPDCSDCKMFYPYLEAYMEEKANNNIEAGIYYLNIKDFRDAAQSEDATDEEKEFYDHLKETLGFAWTPTLKHYSCGKNIDSFEFLDADFGRMDDSVEKQNELNQFVKEFEDWMNTNLEVPED